MDKSELTLFTECTEIYILCFDQYKGHFPLLIYPKKSIKYNKEKMNPILFHPIWFLDVEEKPPNDHINLIYEGRTYSAKKFRTISKRQKRKEGSKKESFEIIVIIISTPIDLYLYGLDFLNIITEKIINNFGHTLYKIIESEYANEEIIKTPKINETIKNGDSLKKQIRNLIKNTYNY